MKTDIMSIQDILKRYNTTAYKKWKDMISIRDNKDGLFHYFTQRELPGTIYEPRRYELKEMSMTSLQDLFAIQEEN